jgi:hypothetical protein
MILTNTKQGVRIRTAGEGTEILSWVMGTGLTGKMTFNQDLKMRWGPS